MRYSEEDNMGVCERCGTEIERGQLCCPNCGTYQDVTVPPNSKPVKDSGSRFWAVFGFLIPFIGLPLWFLWIDKKPKCGKMAGMGALVSVILSVFLWMLLFAPVYVE